MWFDILFYFVIFHLIITPISYFNFIFNFCMRLGAIKERRSWPNKETWKEFCKKKKKEGRYHHARMVSGQHACERSGQSTYWRIPMGAREEQVWKEEFLTDSWGSEEEFWWLDFFFQKRKMIRFLKGYTRLLREKMTRFWKGVWWEFWKRDAPDFFKRDAPDFWMEMHQIFAEGCTRFFKRDAPDFWMEMHQIFEEGCTRFLKRDAPDFGEERTQILIRIKVQLHHWEEDHQPATPFLIHFQGALKRGKENWQQHWHPDSWTSMIGPPPICTSILHPHAAISKAAASLKELDTTRTPHERTQSMHEEKWTCSPPLVHNTHIVGCEEIFFFCSFRKKSQHGKDLDTYQIRHGCILEGISQWATMHALSISMCIKKEIKY